MRNDVFPWIPWHEDRYSNATKWFSSPWQDQIYRPLCIQYCIQGPLADDEEELRGYCRMTSTEFDEPWNRFWPKIKERKFTLEDGTLHNEFGDEVRAWQRKQPQQKSSAGKEGARVRWERERAAAAAAAAGETAPDEWAEVKAAAEIYNTAATQHAWPACDKLTDTRKKKLRARLKDAGGLEGWKTALEKAAASDFLMGRTARDDKHTNWKLDLDFLLQESSFTKLMEGKYDNRTSPGGGGTNPRGRAASVEERRAAIARAVGIAPRVEP